MATEAPQSPDLKDDGKPKTGREAVDRVADVDLDDKDSPGVHPDTASAATEWFLTPNFEEEVAKAIVPLNLAPAGQPEKVVDFTVQVLDRDRIRDIRRESEFTNASGIREVDEMEANLRMAVESLIDPPIKSGSEEFRTVAGQYFPDPADALRARFAYKPGLIDQIAAKVVEISGYSAGDVKEVKAAGN